MGPLNGSKGAIFRPRWVISRRSFWASLAAICLTMGISSRQPTGRNRRATSEGHALAPEPRWLTMFISADSISAGSMRLPDGGGKDVFNRCNQVVGGKKVPASGTLSQSISADQAVERRVERSAFGFSLHTAKILEF